MSFKNAAKKNSVDKNVNLDRLPQIVKKLNEHNIDIKALYMIGFPGETRAQIQKTVDLALNLGVLDFNLSIVTALPGTPLYDDCLEKGMFLEGTTVNNLNYSKSNIKLGDITADELEEIRRSVWEKAFIKRMERNKKNFDEKGSKDKYVWTSLEDYQFHGFKTRPHTREKNKQQETTTAVAI